MRMVGRGWSLSSFQQSTSVAMGPGFRRDDSGNQFTELLTTTSINLVPGRLKAEESTGFN